MTRSELAELWRLSRRRLHSARDYREFQACQARLLCRYLERRGVLLNGRRVLDLGSGLGGYSLEFARRGARVLSLDLWQSPVLGASEATLLRGEAGGVPLRQGTVDFVFCASLIEHVPDPGRVLREIERVLVPGGVSYVSFPPYFSPLGGHEFAPLHYLGERLALRLRRHRPRPDWVQELYPAPAMVASFARTHEGWGLYKMTIAGFRRLVGRTKLQIVDVSTRYLRVGTARWFLLGELLTWHVQFLLAKPLSRERDPHAG